MYLFEDDKGDENDEDQKLSSDNSYPVIKVRIAKEVERSDCL